MIKRLTTGIRHKVLEILGSNVPFDGETQIFQEACQEASCVLEYGCGLSSNWVLTNTNAKLISVDNSEYWLERIFSPHRQSARLTAVYVDTGHTKKWGIPANYEKRENFIKYVEAPWKSDERVIDVILIDGRFRIACFIYSLLNARVGAKIIFDDFAQSSKYQVVNEFLAPIKVDARQALFIVPKIDVKKRKFLEKELMRFQYVTE